MELFTKNFSFYSSASRPSVLHIIPLGTLYYCPLHYRMYYLNVTEIFCDLEKVVINQMIL